MSKQSFDKLLLEAIDEGLSTLGESAKQAIYYHLEKSFTVKRQEIPEKMKTFAGALEDIFGVGANFLEILIMRRLYEKAGQDFKMHDAKNLSFIEYVAIIKQGFMKKTKKGELTL